MIKIIKWLMILNIVRLHGQILSFNNIENGLSNTLNSKNTQVILTSGLALTFFASKYDNTIRTNTENKSLLPSRLSKVGDFWGILSPLAVWAIMSKRNMNDNEEIIEILENKGFKSYKVSELSFFEQIYLFNKAKVIIGPHGAAFSNLIFSKKELKLFEIIPSDHLSLKCKRFSNILGFEYNRFNLERIDEADGDMFLDKKTLTKILSSV